MAVIRIMTEMMIQRPRLAHLARGLGLFSNAVLQHSFILSSEYDPPLGLCLSLKSILNTVGKHH